MKIRQWFKFLVLREPDKLGKRAIVSFSGNCLVMPYEERFDLSDKDIKLDVIDRIIQNLTNHKKALESGELDE